ncbi:hypothetical protein KAS14_05800 [Candidatus Bathyarchaeota archaeon]|nr:hypothetical protein [Candidatus Bathyarchaeota archaeon]
MNNKVQIKSFSVTLFLYLCIITITPTCLAQPINLATIEGLVIEDLTNDPIENATVIIWTEGGKLKSTSETDSNGYYKIEIEGGVECRVYAYYDNQSTLGFDYVPAFQSFYLHEETEVNITFRLVPAASIILDGDILFVESTKTPSKITFTVIDPNSGFPLTGNDRVYIYEDTYSSHTHFLDLTSSHVIIPADVDVNIKVNSSVFVENEGYGSSIVYHDFIIGSGESFKLSKGLMVHVDVRKYSTQFNLNLLKDLVGNVEETLNETEKKGFYIIAETRDLETIGGLMKKAEEELTQDLYDKSHADLREAYIGIADLNNRLGLMHAEASISTNILIIFLAFTAIALAYIFLERVPQKVLATCIIYAALLLVLHRTYPGSKIIDTALFLKTGIASLSAAFSFAFILPHILKERAVEGRIAFRSALTAVFSMAKRNLRRRRLRFTLTLITVTVLVMSFVSLTSFSTGYGLTARPLVTATPPSEGFLIRTPRSPTLPSIITFLALNPSAVDWIQGKSETTLIAPKAENIPSLEPLAKLEFANNSAQVIQLHGILGIQPSAEDSITHFNSIIIDGRNLRDNEEAVLISTLAAEKLNATIGDKLLSNGFEVELVGIFEGNLFNQLRDLDGTPITPKKTIMIDPGDASRHIPPTYAVVPCNPSEIVITTWQNALNYSRVLLSRIAAQVNDAQNILPLARRVALERDYWVWSAIGGQVYLTSLKEYFEVKGLPIFIPWFIVMLNIVTTMLNAIFERRREIAILSSVGLNPSHITALFVAESSIIGIIGGGVGYLSGLSLYRIMSMLSITLEIRQKVSAAWSIGALGIAATAVVIGALVALRSSVIVTPSLLRRWKVKEKPSTLEEQWVFNIPTKIRQSEINAFLDYIKRRFKKYESNVDVLRIGRLKQIDEETPQDITKRIKFNYYYGGGTFGGFFTVNEFVATKKKGEEIYTIKMFSKGSEDWSYKTANFIRTLILEWSAVKK